MSDRKMPSMPGTGKNLARKKRKKHRPVSFSALEIGDLQMVRMLREGNPDIAHDRDLNGMTLLRTAVFRGARKFVDLLLEVDVELDAFEAAVLGETGRLEELLESGEAKPTDEGPEGYGLLHLCAMFGKQETAELLLDRGAPIDVMASHPLKVRPVHSAAAGRQYALVAWFLDRGADLHGPQAGDWTLLHHAAQQGDLAFAEDLLARGAKADVKNAKGQSPLDVARGLGHAEVADRLEAAAKQS